MRNVAMSVSTAEVLDCQCNRCGEDHAAEDTEYQEERSHHSGHVLVMSNHVAATYDIHT